MTEREETWKRSWGARLGFLGINLGALAGSVFLVQFFHTPSIMVVNAIPIIACGWWFGKYRSFLSAILLFIASSVYFKLTGKEIFIDPQGLALGVISFSIFSGAGFALRSVRDLYTEIHLLNAEINDKNRMLRESTLRDPLTDLHNRRYVEEYVSELATTFLRQISTPEFAFRKLGVDNKVILVMVADIDHFKKINDLHGHGAGDQALVEVSCRIKASVRFDDTVIRWGGEEFLVVCPMVDHGNAEQVIAKVLDGVRTSPVVLADGTSLPVTISMGCVWLPMFRTSPFTVSFEDSIKVADRALYDAKSKGRNHGRMIVAKESALASDAFKSGRLDEFYDDPSLCEVRIVP